MKRIKNILKSAILIVLFGCSTIMTSCTDFLTIYPTNTVIHENFWQSADDVNGMLAAAYLDLLSEDAVKKYIVWGELRADNLTARTNTENELKYIVEANLLDNNPYCNWSVFYEAINYANLVLKYAPLVPDRDPNFTEGDLDVVMGEMYALRALCHFYLVRTFRDIPLALNANLDDRDLPNYPQVHPTVALDSIMSDLNRAVKKVMRSGAFPSVNQKSNYGRITRNAVYAMKADVALWQAAFATYHEGDTIKVGNKDDYYRVCIECCDSVIEAMNRQLKEDNEKAGISNIEMGPGTRNPYYLIENAANVNTSRNSLSYDNIFGFGNSNESIFELQFDGNNDTKNGALIAFYGHPDASGKFSVARSFVEGEGSIYFKALQDKKKTNDLRLTSFTTVPSSVAGTSTAEKSEVSVAKYMSKYSPAANANGNTDPNNYRSRSNCDANWIVYRKTDVMLMKAEALSLLSTSTAKDLRDGFSLVKAVNDRSMIDVADSLQYTTNYSSREGLHSLVLDERARELAFEGKRWYDLVRKALCDKSTKNILFVADKLTSNSGAVKSKISSINSLFFPIYESELDLNPLLVQNPAYEKSESIQQQ